MTTPTKEQIERIAKLIFITKRDEPITDMEYDGLSDYWDRCLGNHTKWRYRAKAKVAITEWEKIRNKKQNACTKKSCWYYCGSNSDGCFLPESYQHRPTCFVSHKKAGELMADWEAKKEDK